MAYYAVHYTYVDDPRVEEVRPQHRAFLGALAEQKVLRASGPYVDATPASALLIFEAASESDVRALLADDPFQRENLVAETTVQQWNPVIGVFAS